MTYSYVKEGCLQHNQKNENENENKKIIGFAYDFKHQIIV